MVSRKLKILIPSGIILLIFLVSLTFWLLAPSRTTRRVFFFPEMFSQTVSSSFRYVPAVSGKENSITMYVSEILLGPHLFGHVPLFPSDTHILSVKYRENTVYINFNRELAFYEAAMEITRMFEIMTNSIVYNFPYVEDVIYFIDGYQTGRHSGLTE